MSIALVECVSQILKNFSGLWEFRMQLLFKFIRFHAPYRLIFLHNCINKRHIQGLNRKLSLRIKTNQINTM